MSQSECSTPIQCRAVTGLRSGVSHCSREDADDSNATWSETDIVRLQFILLDECRSLANPAYPLSEKLDILRWIYADGEHAAAPFSFHRCVRSAWGSCDVAAVRVALLAFIPQWIEQSLEQCPVSVRDWVRGVLRVDPTWLAERLDSNPQFINETARALKQQPDLFAMTVE